MLWKWLFTRLRLVCCFGFLLLLLLSPLELRVVFLDLRSLDQAPFYLLSYKAGSWSVHHAVVRSAGTVLKAYFSACTCHPGGSEGRLGSRASASCLSGRSRLRPRDCCRVFACLPLLTRYGSDFAIDPVRSTQIVVISIFQEAGGNVGMPGSFRHMLLYARLEPRGCRRRRQRAEVTASVGYVTAMTCSTSPGHGRPIRRRHHGAGDSTVSDPTREWT